METKQRNKFILMLGTGLAMLVTAGVILFALPDDGPAVPNTVDYFPVQDPETGKWGFIDAQGNAVTPMVFDWAGDYRQGRGLVLIGGAMGYIDETYSDTGDLAIAARFRVDPDREFDQSAYGFYDGLALARDDEGLWGFIDRDGKWVIEPRFAESDDYPGVPVGEFSEGLAWFQVVEMDDRYSSDENHEIVRDEAGRPVMEAYRRRLIGYIDRDGDVVIEPGYIMAADFGQGLAAFRDKAHGAWGFIDRDGSRAIPPEFDEVGRFSEDLCAVSKNGLWGYIDADGDVVIDYQFAEARQFLGGLAPAREGELWGYINPRGEWVIQPAYDNFGDGVTRDDPRPFENGMAVCRLRVRSSTSTRRATASGRGVIRQPA